jgi:hypothetical protein
MRRIVRLLVCGENIKVTGGSHQAYLARSDPDCYSYIPLEDNLGTKKNPERADS